MEKKKYTNQEVTLDLEKTMVRYRDLLSIPVQENNEQFITLSPDTIPNGYVPAMGDMETITGPSILLRECVSQRLQRAQQLLQNTDPDYTLYVTYGYRSLEIQTEKFIEQIRNATSKFFPDPTDLYEEAHRFIAVPTVAGHPTGGAVDIVIKETDKSIDFGGQQYDFTTKNCYVFSPNITEKARQNRLLLRDSMMQAGFAPFDGEWWHFSYGDREWAHYYQKPYALYEQKSYKEVMVDD